MNNTRAAAVRRAQQAKQMRDAQRLERERQVEQALADFFEHHSKAEQITEQAAAKAARIVADAEHSATTPRQQAARAIAGLYELGETRTAIADLAALSVATVRQLLADAASTQADHAAPEATTTTTGGGAGAGTAGTGRGEQ